MALSPRDYAGNAGPARNSTVAVYKTLSHVASARTVFYPQDLDEYARHLRFSYALSVSATLSGVIRNEAGDVVRTMFDSVPMSAGSHLFDWDGRRTDGTMAPRGTYTAAISATDGVLAATGLAAVVADGFRVTVSDSTRAAARGSSCMRPPRATQALAPGQGEPAGDQRLQPDDDPDGLVHVQGHDHAQEDRPSRGRPLLVERRRRRAQGQPGDADLRPALTGPAADRPRAPRPTVPIRTGTFGRWSAASSKTYGRPPTFAAERSP